MDKDVFGYLLVTQNSINKVDTIKKDYRDSTRVMNAENAVSNKNYSCCIVCMNCSWWFRRRLAKKIGISMKKIHKVKYLRSPQNNYEGFDVIMAADSMVDDTFFGRTKVYDCEHNIPSTELNLCDAIVYDC